MTVATDIKESLTPIAAELIDRFVKECIEKRLVPTKTYRGLFTVEEEYKLFGLFTRTREVQESRELAGWRCPNVKPDYWILENGDMCYVQAYQYYRRGIPTYQADEPVYRTLHDLSVLEINFLIGIFREHFNEQPAS